MTKHKWHKEIKAWADGQKIESESQYLIGVWQLDISQEWDSDEFIFRIKPQPKESQYLCAWLNKKDFTVIFEYDEPVGSILEDDDVVYIGKIKLEVDDDN